jgi:cyclase
MLKKRIIFTLLYNDGFFVQSRNFNLQKVGDFKWIIKNYNFRNISFFIDELIILDISRDKRDINKFIYSVENIIDSCFVPVAVGGGIDSLEKAKILLSKIADKVGEEIGENIVDYLSLFFKKDGISKIEDKFKGIF